MRLKVVNQGIQELERKWFDIVRVDKKPVNIIPASKALFYLIDELYNEDPNRRSEVYIRSVKLGYRLETHQSIRLLTQEKCHPIGALKLKVEMNFLLKLWSNSDQLLV